MADIDEYYDLDENSEKKIDKEPYSEKEEVDHYCIEEDEDEQNAELEEIEDQQEEPKSERHSHPSAWKLLLYMMINPVQGWKNIRRAGTTVEDVSKECFYPLTGVAAASCLLECFWKTNIGLNHATINALKTFVAFFFGNFLILLLIKLIFPKSIKDIADSDFGKKFVMYNLSTLAIFFILYECLPMIGPLLVFLPIWTIYLILRGSGFFLFPSNKASLLRTLLSVFIIGTPIAVYWIIDLFL